LQTVRAIQDLKTEELIKLYAASPQATQLAEELKARSTPRIFLRGLAGSSHALVIAAVFHHLQRHHLVVLNDAEAAAYFYNDLEALFHEKSEPYEKKNTLYFPTAYKRHFEFDKPDRTNMLMRSEVMSRLVTSQKKLIIVTYAEALAEKVVRKKVLTKNTLKLQVGEKVSLDFIADVLIEYGFEREDFVYEPGQFSIRGGIIDVFSFAHDQPFRLEFFGEEVESIRSFDPATQLSVDRMDRITILPDLSERLEMESLESFLSFMPPGAMIWAAGLELTLDLIRLQLEKVEKLTDADTSGLYPKKLREHFLGRDEFLRQLLEHALAETGNRPVIEAGLHLEFKTSPQPSFNKNFDLLVMNLAENTRNGFSNFILSENPRQIERIYTIFEDIKAGRKQPEEFGFSTLNISLHEGFLDEELKLALYTDHQIFERYHKFHLKDSYSSREAITLKDLYHLNPGDYVTHIDHGIGRFDGLEKIDVNGRQQEAIRIIYQNNDLLYISIHSLHRISKYIGKDGAEPRMDRLGSGAWNRLKTKTKNRVKDIAKELIELYATRKSAEGFSFAPDTYLQTELEASFIYEDTPDQVKSTADVKADMEKSWPMDRLICGDVGFGKTEIAIRAAFKAVSDSKQVAVLVPTTILALQHYKTFRDRLKDFPATVDYLNRFKSPAKQKETLKKLEEGTLDIIIGTHRLISQDVKFKDLGLLIIDEEQKFGVGAKEKLKRLRVNVDSLTLTATPIPRTLQFSLMGARDLSIINTPPPNRYPIQTELRMFGEEVIREAILYEVSRGGQVFFVHNRIQNIHEVEGMIKKFIPNITIGVAHGQMDGEHLENVMLDFIEGSYDVLLSTAIIESGLDIPNANTIIINDAHHFGLSDLHQLRGRVGRSNKKAFCYLLAPPASLLTEEARKRLRAIEEFSDLGSGFNIAMRDLDIRGAGNILGAEQSGFISDIGFEMYHKILDEALQELKETEFKELFQEERTQDFVRDCQIETDLEILIPGEYISNTTERLIVYKELDSIETEEYLQKFQHKLTDRFGPVPRQTLELIDTVRLRWLARKVGFEKIVLKNERLIGYFLTDQQSEYYQSGAFSAILSYVQKNPSICRMKETESRLSLTFRNVTSVSEAIRILKGIEASFLSTTPGIFS
jgi:transcription-repair coupling factor (superfamily II helicase)